MNAYDKMTSQAVKITNTAKATVHNLSGPAKTFLAVTVLATHVWSFAKVLLKPVVPEKRVNTDKVAVDTSHTRTNTHTNTHAKTHIRKVMPAAKLRTHRVRLTGGTDDLSSCLSCLPIVEEFKTFRPESGTEQWQILTLQALKDAKSSRILV